ncbi:MAG TPA: DUF21 domain-containing protein [Planctomycetes bacterium]|nr:DUF21 domain-containing protein [Planctomycetota bacterium]
MLNPFDAVLFIGALLCEAFFSGSETGSYAVSRIRLRYLSDAGDGRAAKALALISNHPSLVVTTLVGTNIAVYLSGRAALSLTQALRGDGAGAELIATVWLTPVIFLFGEMAPKWWFRRAADAWFPAAARLLVFFRTLFAPAVWLLLGVVALLRRLLPLHAEEAVSAAKCLERAFSRQGIHEYIRSVAAEKGVVKPAQQMVLDVVLKRFRRPVVEVAAGVVFQAVVQPSATVRQTVGKAAQHDSSTVLVSADGRNMLGAVYVYELAGVAADENITGYIRELPEVPAKRSVEEVLEEMRRLHKSAALVIDEDSTTIGVISVSGILEFLLRGRSGMA